MRKGTTVKLKAGDKWSRPQVLRQTTQEEQQAWYEKLHEECKSGRNVPYDSAGESKLAPQCAVIEARDDDTFTVVRGRCAPFIGWCRQTKSALVRNNRTGEEGYIKRCYLEVI